jgi:type IV fimbrial biogenesis protein FimT
MVETLAVVAIIGIMAAVASPVFVNQMLDSRANRLAMQVAETYRLARSRAMGRGAAVLVRWDSSLGMASKGQLSTWEAITPGSLPSPSCLTTSWTVGSPQNRNIDLLDAGSRIFQNVTVGFRQPGGAAAPFSEICFTPRGFSWSRINSGNAFTQLTGVPSFVITNPTSAGKIRTVLVPPNGVARIAL